MTRDVLEGVSIGLRENDDPRLDRMALRCAEARTVTRNLSRDIVSGPRVRDDGDIEITAFDRSRITWLDRRPSGGMVNLQHWKEDDDGSILRLELRFPRNSLAEDLSPQGLPDLEDLLSLGERACRTASRRGDDRVEEVRQVMNLVLESDPRAHVLSAPTPWSPMAIHLSPEEEGEPFEIDPAMWAMIESHSPKTLDVIELASTQGTTKILLTPRRIEVGGAQMPDTVAALRALAAMDAR
jgi:hypothetical protein